MGDQRPKIGGDKTVKKNSVQVRAGPLGYVYARHRRDLSDEVVSLLAAKTEDRPDVAVLPLLKGVTVEKSFCSNVAAVSGARTVGLGGAGAATAKLLPTHYSPCAFVFYGASAVAASSRAPNLTVACETARERFGYSAYSSAPCPNARETTGEQICRALGLEPSETALYLVVTQAFREVVYLCNSFLHYGGAEAIAIAEAGDGDSRTEGQTLRGAVDLRERDATDEDRDGAADVVNANGRRVLAPGEAVRVPLYPLQLAMPDFNRVNTEPFNANHRSLGDGYRMPTAFFNDELCRLLHGYVLGPAAVTLRVRNLDAVARGSAHLSFDENHESVVLPNDVPFCLLESEREACADGGPPDSHASPATQGNGAASGNGGASGVSVFPAGLGRRTASLMAADATVSAESLMSTFVHDETLPDPAEWPLLSDAADGRDAVSRLGAYLARAAGLVGAMIFSPNSALYMTDVEDAYGPWGPAESAKLSDDHAFGRFYQTAAPHAADSTLVDRDGRVVRAGPGHAANPKIKTAPSSPRAMHEFQLDYLCLACGFCPQILAKLLFYLERVDAGAAAYRFDSDALRFAASAIDSDVSCDLCDRYEKHLCVRTLLHRLRHRLPKFGGAPYNGAVGLFGAVTSNYCDMDQLGDYAAFTKLKRLDGEENRAVIQDTYRVAVERLMAELESAGLIGREDPGDPGAADAFVRDAASFVEAFSLVRSLAEREAVQLMQTLVKTREFNPTEGLADANHVLFLTAEPYAAGFCPALAFLHRRSLLTVLQDAALSQCHSVMEDHQVEARNFRTQFQSLVRKRVLGLWNMGFFCTRPTTLVLADPGISMPDPCADQHAPPLVDADGDLVRVNVDVLKQLKIKSRLMFSGGNPASADQAARARLAGMADAYRRPDKKTDVLVGALGFALKRYHLSLFPDHRPAAPAGGAAPLSACAPRIARDSGAAAAAQWFWTKLQKNQMPAKRLKKDDVDLITFVKRYTDEYAGANFINVPPSCVGDLAQFTLANAVLRLCDHKNFFITTVTGIVAQAKKPRDPSSVLQWVEGRVSSGAELETAARALVESADARPAVWTSAYSTTNLMRHATWEKPLIVLGVRVSKYAGASGNNRPCQTGHWGALMSGRNACSLMPFDRTRRYALLCPRIGFVARRTGGYFSTAVKEKTIVDQIKSIMAEGGSAPHAAIFAAALKTLGERVRDMDEDDWTTLVGDPYTAASLAELNRAAEAAPQGWTLAGAERVAREAETDGGGANDGDEAAFDFGACDDSPADCGGLGGTNGLLLDDGASTSSLSSLGAAVGGGLAFYGDCATAGKRPAALMSDPLFDMDLPGPPEAKRPPPALTVDML